MNRTSRILSLAIAGGLSLFQAKLLAQTGHGSSLEGLPVSGTSFTSFHELNQAGFLESTSNEEAEMSADSTAADNTTATTGGVSKARSANSNTRDADGSVSTDSNQRGSFEVMPSYGSFTTPQLDGHTYSLPAYANFKLSDRLGLNFNLPMQYSEIDTAGGELDVWNVNATVGLSIKVIKKAKDSPFSWTLTPHLGGGGYYADDGADSHTTIGHGGMTSMIGYQNQYLAVSLANQITCFETLDTAGSYDFVPDVHQKVWKNGLKISVPFAHRWVADAYAIHTEFLENAFVDRYFTLGASVGYHLAKMKKGSYVKLGTYTELAEHFQSVQVQFGTGWKF